MPTPVTLDDVGATPCLGTFIALVGTEGHVPAALCFRQQMADVGTRCLLHLAVADQINGSALSDSSWAALGRAYGEDRLIRLSSLASTLAESRTARGHAGRSAAGRRLFHGVGKAITTSKIMLWALPPKRFPTVAYIDLDVLVLQNMDHLLTRPRRKAVGGVPIPISCGFAPTDAFFNGGVLVFKPSLDDAHGLELAEHHTKWPWRGFFPRGDRRWADECAPRDPTTGLTNLSRIHSFHELRPEHPDAFGVCRAHYNGTLSSRMALACEPSFTDQSIMNHWCPHSLETTLAARAPLETLPSHSLPWQVQRPLGAAGRRVERGRPPA